MDVFSKLERMKDVIEDQKGEIQELREMEEWKINFQIDVCMLVIQGALADDMKKRPEVVERMSMEMEIANNEEFIRKISELEIEIANNEEFISKISELEIFLFEEACRLNNQNRRYEDRCSDLSDRLHKVDKDLCMYKSISEFLKSSIVKEITDLRARIDGVSTQLEGRLKLFEDRTEECKAKIRELSSVTKEKNLEAQNHAALIKSVKEEKNNQIQELLKDNKLQRNTVSSSAKMIGDLKNKAKDLETHRSDLEKKLTNQENNYTEQLTEQEKKIQSKSQLFSKRRTKYVRI